MLVEVLPINGATTNGTERVEKLLAREHKSKFRSRYGFRFLLFFFFFFFFLNFYGLANGLTAFGVSYVDGSEI